MSITLQKYTTTLPMLVASYLFFSYSTRPLGPRTHSPQILQLMKCRKSCRDGGGNQIWSQQFINTPSTFSLVTQIAALLRFHHAPSGVNHYMFLWVKVFLACAVSTTRTTNTNPQQLFSSSHESVGGLLRKSKQSEGSSCQNRSLYTVPEDLRLGHQLRNIQERKPGGQTVCNWTPEKISRCRLPLFLTITFQFSQLAKNGGCLQYSIAAATV